jgi:23S rRNA (uracil-5-)-methyltransferase RumA
VILKTVADWATNFTVPVYVRRDHSGLLRHLLIREGKNTGQRLVNLVAKSATPHVDVLARSLKDSAVSIDTFVWSAYDGLSDVLGSDASQCFWGDGYITERIGRIEFKVTPATFTQTNTHAAEQMISTLRTWIEQYGAAPDGRLLDLYCGSGTIGLNLADLFSEVVGVELNPQAVEDARRASAHNGITNARFEPGSTEKVISDWTRSRPHPKDAVVVDPPRAGLHPEVVTRLLDWRFPTIYYVSCNPVSLGRDLRRLASRYTILDVQPMDFFPHTDHVETVVRLTSNPEDPG